LVELSEQLVVFLNGWLKAEFEFDLLTRIPIVIIIGIIVGMLLHLFLKNK